MKHLVSEDRVEIGVGTYSAIAVVDASISKAVGVIVFAAVRLIRWVILREVIRDSRRLVARSGIDVTKATSRAKSGGRNFLIFGREMEQRESGSTDRSQVWACCWEVGGEYVVGRSQTGVRVATRVLLRDTRVTAGHKD